ncbi:MAG TPA: signal peptidase I [Bryobacteraceae bacterium]|nr:signal peptidase I [Bryobacteraceae bacterium]
MGTTTETKPKAAEAVQPAKRRTEQRGFVAEWTWTILILVFAITFVAQVMAIPTSSMHNTLLTGDHLIIDKLAYSPPGAVSRYLLPYEDVKRGDIIVFRHPILLDENYVKRCIGVPGDHIKLVNKQLWLNGHLVNEPYAIHITPYYDPYRDNFPQGSPDFIQDPRMYERAQDMLRNNVVNGELVVPPGNYFAMGDNRDNSLDSRYWGLVPRGNIIGKPAIILWSYDAPTQDLQTYNVHHFVDLAEHFFTKTRWNRTLKLVQGYPLQ